MCALSRSPVTAGPRCNPDSTIDVSFPFPRSSVVVPVNPGDDRPPSADDATSEQPDVTRPAVLAHLAVLRPKAARIAVLIAAIAFGLGLPAG